MDNQSFTTSFLVGQTPEEAYAAINRVREWWTGEPGVEGSTDKLGDEFTYRYGDIHYSKQKVTELIPGQKIVWRVIDSNLSFIKDTGEWNGTTITFEITKQGEQTQIRFTHLGLVPEIECFNDCSEGWTYYVEDSLMNFITIGKGQPASTEG